MRTVVFEASALIILPLLFGANGIWWATVLAEFLATIMTIIFILAKGNKYGILKRG